MRVDISELTIVGLDVLEAVCTSDLEVHLGQHNAGLRVEDADVGLGETDSVPQAVDGHLGHAVRGEGVVETQMGAP
jgi:hypothetical protein